MTPQDVLETPDIPVGQIRANPWQPRTLFDELELGELSQSIRAHGVIQPLVVTRENGHFVLIAGERRLEASKRAGRETVPCVVRPAAADLERLELSLVENLQRADLTAIEQARAFERLATEFGLTNEAIGARVGRDRSTVANLRRLLTLPTEIQDQVHRGVLAEGKARELIPIAAVRPAVAIAAAKALTGPAPTPRVDADEDDAVVEDETDKAEPDGPAKLPDEILWEAWEKVAVKIEYDNPFGLKWDPGVETLEHDGVAVPVRACAGCDDLKQRGYKKLCTRPACYRAKFANFAAMELEKVSRALGIPVAAPGEHAARVKVHWGNQDKVAGWVKKAADHLRLKAGEPSYNEARVLNSEAVQLYTTKPHLLDEKKDPSPEDAAARQAAEKRERRRQEWEEAQIWALAERHAPALGKAFAGLKPGARQELLRGLETASYETTESENRLDALLGKAAQKRTSAEECELLALLLFAIRHEWRDSWKDATKALAAMAGAFGVHLPKGWDEMPKMPKEAPEEAKADAIAAKKGKGKK